MYGFSKQKAKAIAETYELEQKPISLGEYGVITRMVKTDNFKEALGKEMKSNVLLASSSAISFFLSFYSRCVNSHCLMILICFKIERVIIFLGGSYVVVTYSSRTEEQASNRFVMTRNFKLKFFDHNKLNL
ncbi:hypothetical protein OAG_20125 [Vibrio cyclitrophicus FF75]|nr:hypothetical protein OAG_20125 [Vibrio cyclitrophicus FF75]